MQPALTLGFRVCWCLDFGLKGVAAGGKAKNSEKTRAPNHDDRAIFCNTIFCKKTFLQKCLSFSASSTNKRNQNPQPSGVGSKPSGSQTLKPGFWRLQKPQILNPQFSALRFRSLGFPGQSVKQSVAAELRCAMCELQECMFFGCFVSPLFFSFLFSFRCRHDL